MPHMVNPAWTATINQIPGAPMKTAAEFQAILERYRWLCQEIEWSRHLVVGDRSYPVDSRRWKSWKEKQALKWQIDMNTKPRRELSKDPQYQRLIDLDEQIQDVWHEIQGHYDEPEAEQALLREVVASFPSLRIIEPGYEEMRICQILCDGEAANPQAYQAALFVHTLHTRGMCRHESDAVFFIDMAFEIWDDAHKEAFARWIAMPCFPADEFRRLSADLPSV